MTKCWHHRSPITIDVDNIDKYQLQINMGSIQIGEMERVLTVKCTRSKLYGAAGMPEYIAVCNLLGNKNV